MPSPECLVNNASTVNGADVTGGATVTIALASTAGVKNWELDVVGTDDWHSPSSFAVVVDQVNKTATTIAPSDACAVRYRSRINNGVDEQGIARPDYTTTFGVFVRSPKGLRLGALNETFEGHSIFGWTSKFNDCIRSVDALGSPSAKATQAVAAGASWTTILTIPISAADGTNVALGLLIDGASGTTVSNRQLHYTTLVYGIEGGGYPTLISESQAFASSLIRVQTSGLNVLVQANGHATLSYQWTVRTYADTVTVR